MLSDIVARLSGKRVLIVGDIMLDEYIWGEVRRVSPEAPVPVVEVSRRTSAPGGAANVAVNVVSLGGHAELGGVIGQDPGGNQLREMMMAWGIDRDGIQVDSNRPTTCKTRVIAHNQQVVRFDAEHRVYLDPQVEADLMTWVRGKLPIVDVCILSDYGKGVVSPRLANELIKVARAKGKAIVVDPKGRDYSKYCGATVITPNLLEAELVLNREVRKNTAELLGLGADLLDLMPGSAVLITRGADGMSLFSSGGPPIHIPAVGRQVFDVTGAGDTVTSTLALALAAGADLEHAARLANWAAGIVVAKLGTATVAAEELLQGLEDRPG